MSVRQALRTKDGAATSSRVRGVIFDGDDTLWLTEPLYDDARRMAREFVEVAGLDGGAWERLQRLRDVENVTVLGHSVDRFPTSCVEAFELVGGKALTDAYAVRERVRFAARTVFTARAPRRPGAAKALERLTRRGTRLALLTKGDCDVQRRRIAHSGLARHFDVVSIVDTKTAASFAAVVNELRLKPDEVVSVGNSIVSDIQPSLAAGVDAVWIPAYVWEYERCHDPAVEASLQQIRDFDDLLRLVDDR